MILYALVHASLPVRRWISLKAVFSLFEASVEKFFFTFATFNVNFADCVIPVHIGAENLSSGTSGTLKHKNRLLEVYKKNNYLHPVIFLISLVKNQ